MIADVNNLCEHLRYHQCDSKQRDYRQEGTVDCVGLCAASAWIYYLVDSGTEVEVMLKVY